MTDVVITHDTSIDRAIASAASHLPLSSLVTGRRVAIKPNETWASGRDTSGITQPDTLRAVLRAVNVHNPEELIVTGGAGAAETDDVFRVGGLMKVIEEEGVEFFDHNRPPSVRHLWEAARLDVGEADIEKMRFPALSLREAIGRFTEAAYGRRLDFEHA